MATVRSPLRGSAASEQRISPRPLTPPAAPVCATLPPARAPMCSSASRWCPRSRPSSRLTRRLPSRQKPALVPAPGPRRRLWHACALCRRVRAPSRMQPRVCLCPRLCLCVSCVRRARYSDSICIDCVIAKRGAFCSLTLRVLARGVLSVAVPHEGLGYLLLLSANANWSAVGGVPRNPVTPNCGGNLHA